MTEDDVARLAAVVGLTINPATRPAVARQLAELLAAARLFDEFELPEDTEPAPRSQP